MIVLTKSEDGDGRLSASQREPELGEIRRRRVTKGPITPEPEG